MTIPVIYRGLRCCQGNLVVACLKLRFLTAKCIKIKNKNLIIIVFGKWPRYKQDNTFRGVHKEEWMDLAEANARCAHLHVVHLFLSRRAEWNLIGKNGSPVHKRWIHSHRTGITKKKHLKTAGWLWGKFLQPHEGGSCEKTQHQTKRHILL